MGGQGDYCYWATVARASRRRRGVIFEIMNLYVCYYNKWMSDLEALELNNVQDYKLLAYLLAEKLRNPNFQPARRQTFLKTLLSEVKPVCSHKCYERIEKSLNEIAGQKDADQKEAKAKAKLTNNKKDKKLVMAKVGKLDKYGNPIDDFDSEDQEDDDYYEEDGEEYYDERRK